MEINSLSVFSVECEHAGNEGSSLGLAAPVLFTGDDLISSREIVS